MKFTLAGPPHLTPVTTVGGVMRNVLYALVPGVAAHLWFFGPGIVFQILLATAFALGLVLFGFTAVGVIAAPVLISVAGAGWLVDGRMMFGLVVMLAMWGNLVVASSMGAFIPILLESVGIDPAVASSIFVTTLTDLCGFFLLLGLASALLL